MADDAGGDLVMKHGQGTVDVVAGEVLGIDPDAEPDAGSPVLDGDRYRLCHALDRGYDLGKVVTFDAIQREVNLARTNSCRAVRHLRTPFWVCRWVWTHRLYTPKLSLTIKKNFVVIYMQWQ